MTQGPGGLSKRGSHRLAMVAKCPRSWHFRWNLNLVPNEERLYFVEGRLVHIALGYYRMAQIYARTGQAEPWFFEKSCFDMLDEAGKGYPTAIELAKSTLASYAQHYETMGDPWTALHVEKEYAATLGEIRTLLMPGYRLGALPDDEEEFSSRIDLIVEQGGGIFAVDYKTTKHYDYRSKGLSPLNLDGEYAISWQFLLQTAILRIRLGLRFRGVLIERILKKEPHDFSRDMAPISRPIFEALPETLWHLAKQERELAEDFVAADIAEQADEWLPTGYYWHCYQGGVPCEYRPLCMAESVGQRQMTVVREYHRD